MKKSSDTKIHEYEAKAPCRIDLSGGTLDLWPIYLDFEQGLVLNHMALRLYTHAKITVKQASTFRLKIVSMDYGEQRTFKSLEELRASLGETTKENPLRWLARVSHYFLENSGWEQGHFELQTSSEVPPGSGLGGSSALGVALGVAWSKAVGKEEFVKKNPWLLQKILRDLESVEIEHPAGDQDYVPALFGGLITFHMGPALSEVRRHPYSFAKKMVRHMALVYTGKPHHSGINNWSVYKAYIDKKKNIREAIQNIHFVSCKMLDALVSGNLTALEKTINEEWKWRQKLGPKVNAPVLKEAQKWAKTKGATAFKACGSGGGGSLLVFFENEEDRNEFIKLKAPKKSWQILPVLCSKEGALNDV